MPSHKALKNVVHNLAHSFASAANYQGDDYVMGHIVQAAWATGATELRVNLLTGETSQSPLLTPPVKENIAWRVKLFPASLQWARSDIQFVAAAELWVIVDPTKRRLFRDTLFTESPFTCGARIVDDRGKQYEYSFSGWWWPEHPPGDPAASHGKLARQARRTASLFLRWPKARRGLRT